MMLIGNSVRLLARILTGKEPIDSEERGVRPEVSSRPDSGLDISIASEDGIIVSTI